MKISKKSWHYKFMKELSSGESVPQDLCSYFRKLIYRLLCSCLVFVVVTFCLFLIGETPALAFTTTLWHYPLGFLIGGIVVVICGFIICGVVACLVWIEEKYKSKSNGVVSQYFKVKNEKICKHIEFED